MVDLKGYQDIAIDAPKYTCIVKAEDMIDILSLTSSAFVTEEKFTTSPLDDGFTAIADTQRIVSSAYIVAPNEIYVSRHFIVESKKEN